MDSADEAPALEVIADDDVDRIVELSHIRPVLLYFTVVWCGPCKVFGPRLADYAAQNVDLSILKVDSDENPRLADFCGVDVFPTLVLLRHGRVHWTHAGALDDGALRSIVGPVMRAAEQLGSDGAEGSVDAPVHPLRLKFPPLTDRRVTVEVLRRGETIDDPDSVDRLPEDGEVELREGDYLAVIAHGDDRQDPSLDLSVLRQFPAAPYEHVLVHASSLSAAHIADIGSLKTIRSLLLSTLEPLALEAVDAIAAIDAHAVRCRAPGVDSEGLRRRMPGVSVDNSSLSAAMAAVLPSPVAAEKASVTWTSVEDLRALVDSGGTVVAMIQAEHPADHEIAADWHRAVVEERASGAYAVSAHGSTLIEELALESGCPIVVVFRGGRQLWRRDLAEVSAGLHVESILSRAVSTPLALRPVIREERRIIRFTAEGDPLHVDLIAPGAAEPVAAFDLRSGDEEMVPEGWRVRLRVHASDREALRWTAWAQLGIQDLVLSGEFDDADFADIVELEDIEHLVVYCSGLTGPATAATLGRLPKLRTVRLHANDASAEVRRALPDVIVDGEWPGSDAPE